MKPGVHLFVNDDGTIGNCGRMDPCPQCEAGEPPTSVSEAMRESNRHIADQRAEDWIRGLSR